MRLPVWIVALGLGGMQAIAQDSPPSVAPADVGMAQGGPEALRVTVGARASVSALPRVDSAVSELIVRGSDVDLDALLHLRNTPSIAAMDALHGGGRVWYLRIAPRDASAEVQAAMDGEDLVLRVVPKTARPRRLSVPGPQLDALVDGLATEAAAAPLEGPLRPIAGDGIALAMEPWDYTPVYSPTPPWLPKSSWEAVDRARNAMLSAESADAELQAQYRLALHYLELGFAKEARFYLDRATRRPGPIPQRDLSLARGRVALANGGWDEAREHYKAAHRLGASPVAVVEGLAIVSLATGFPSRAPTARALAERAGRPESQLLAAELLQRDGRFAESRPILEALGPLEREADRQRAQLRLGDALYADGNHPEAVRAWSSAAPDVASVRQAMLSIINGRPIDWAKAVPMLVQASIPRTDAGAEALYLLAQIDLQIGSREDAISGLAAILSRYPRKASGSDVPERFWAVYSTHVSELAEAGRWFDIAALHESVWSPTVRRAVRDSRVLVDVADAYARVGLPDRSVTVLREAVSVLVAMGSDDPDLVLRLARLYADTERWADGLRTLDYLRRNTPMRGREAEVAMLEARLHAGAGDLGAAAAAYRLAAQSPVWKDEATLQLALLDAEAGRCDAGAATLSALLFSPEGETRYTDPRPWLALSRCLRTQGDATGAARAARVASERTASPEEARYADWLAAIAEGWTDPKRVEALAGGSDVWAALAREQQDANAFSAELEQRRATAWGRRLQAAGRP